MLKLVAVSTIALSALAASVPFSHATDDRLSDAAVALSGEIKCGMQFAAAPELTDALIETSENAARALALAGELARYGAESGSASALLVAADIVNDLNVSEIADSPLELATGAGLLAGARALASGDPVVLAMIDDRLAERSRGSVFAVESYNGQGGESWVPAGDSMMFTRNYAADTDAVLTLVASDDSALFVRVSDKDGNMVCEGQIVDGAHSCVWPANAGGDYAIHVRNQASDSVAFTIWTN